MGRKTKQNKICTPELIAKINPKNIRLMNDFLEYLRSVGKAESTVKAYTSDLYIFFVWVLQNADKRNSLAWVMRCKVVDCSKYIQFTFFACHKWNQRGPAKFRVNDK